MPSATILLAVEPTQAVADSFPAGRVLGGSFQGTAGYSKGLRLPAAVSGGFLNWGLRGHEGSVFACPPAVIPNASQFFGGPRNAR